MARSDTGAREKRLANMMVDLGNIEPNEILPYLTCLTRTGKEQVRRNISNYGSTIAVTEMFEKLSKRPNWYNILVHALREMGEDVLADKLEGPEKRLDPLGPSQSVAMPGTSSHSTHASQGKQHYQSPPAHDPHRPAQLQGHPEREASVTPSYPVKGEQNDVSYKGAEQNNDRPAHDVNPGQAASLPIPIHRKIQNISSHSSHSKNLPNIPKLKKYPNDDVNLDNLSPTKSCGEFFLDNKTTTLEAPSVVEEQSEECPPGVARSLSSRDVNPDVDQLLSALSESEILDGISEESTANPRGASHQQRDEGNSVSTAGVQGGGGGVGEGEEEGGVARMEANGGISSLLQRDESSAVSAQRGQEGGGGGGSVGGGEEEDGVGRMEASEQTQSGIIGTIGNFAKAIGGAVLDSLSY